MEFVTDALTFVVARLEQFLYIFLARELDEILLRIGVLLSVEMLGIQDRFGGLGFRYAARWAVPPRPLRMILAEKQATGGQESRSLPWLLDAYINESQPSISRTLFYLHIAVCERSHVLSIGYAVDNRHRYSSVAILTGKPCSFRGNVLFMFATAVRERVR